MKFENMLGAPVNRASAAPQRAPNAPDSSKTNENHAMTNYDKAAQVDYATIVGTARCCIRVYLDLLHNYRANTVDLSLLSQLALTVLREMVLEMYDDYPLMEAGNCVLFIEDEIKRRAEAAR